MFDAEKTIIISSLSCTPGDKDLQDVHPAHIQICRTHDINVKRHRNKHDKNFREAEIMT